MTGLRYSPLHVTEFCGEMQGKFKVGLARLMKQYTDLKWSIVTDPRGISCLSDEPSTVHAV